MIKQPKIDKREIAADRDHLKVGPRTGRLRCRVCGKSITVNPKTGIEYGHSRVRYEKGRCEHRPASVDPV